MTTVKLNGKTLRLNDQQIIGMGGEATVFRHQGEAIKVYLKPTAGRDQKLRAMMQYTHPLPNSVIAPQQLVTDVQDKRVVGFTMRLLDANTVDVRQLAVKKFRAQSPYTSREIVSLFLNGHRTLSQIHLAKMVVGDLNDLNVMFNGQQMLYIDVDSFQFGQYPCVVGTEQFLDPVLYNQDLGQAPLFAAPNDWYAFAVLLFKSLLLTHPYGGIHPNYHLLTQRAVNQISVLDPAVKYPRIAYSPDLLSDDLGQIFERYFTEGKRDIFPEAVLQDYLATATTCPHCHATYPQNRGHCPMCSAVIPVTVPDRVQMETLVQTQGAIIAWHLWGDRLQLLANEGDQVVLHTVNKYRQTRRVSLFKAMPHATYAFVDHMLVISPSKDSDSLMIVDVSGDAAAPILQTTTTRFGGNLPMFGTSGRHLYRLAGSYLMRGYVDYGQLVEQSVMAVSEGQTWFTVDPTAERVFGYFRAFNDYSYWLLIDRERYDADLSPLETGEFLIDAVAKFSDKRVLILRETQLRGVDRVRLDEIDDKGRRVSSPIVQPADDYIPIQAHAYMVGVLLRASDQGIVQSRLDKVGVKTFPQTEPIVKRGNAIHPYEKGLLMIDDQRAIYITV